MCFPTHTDFGDWPRRQPTHTASPWQRVPVVREVGVWATEVQPVQPGGDVQVWPHRHLSGLQALRRRGAQRPLAGGGFGSAPATTHSHSHKRGLNSFSPAHAVLT